MYIQLPPPRISGLQEGRENEETELGDETTTQRSQGSSRRANRTELDRIVISSRTYSEKAAEFLMRQDPTYVYREDLRKVILLQHKRLYGCLSLPLSLVFFLLFALAAFLHEDITNVYLIESGLREHLGAGLGRVESIHDVWAWINGSLVPKLFVQRDLLGEPIPDKARWSRVLTYNQLQGPLVIQQHRSQKVACQQGDALDQGMMCFPMGTINRSSFGRDVNASIASPASDEYVGSNVSLQQREEYYASAFQTAHSGRRLRVVRDEFRTELLVSGAQSSAFEVFIYANTNYSLVQEHINYLYQKGWLDAQSQQLDIKALLLNAEVGRPRLEQVHVMFWFSRGGGVFARLTLESLFLLPWADMVSIATDASWVLLLISRTIAELIYANRARRSGRLCRSCQNYRTVLKLFTVGFGWACVLGYVLQEPMRKQVVNRFGEVVDAQLRDVPADLNTLGRQLHDVTGTYTVFTSWMRIFIAEYHLVLLFSFFTAFSSQPRLGIVTGTLEASIIDIIHFLVVLVPTFMAYAIIGCFLFGRRLEEFSTIKGSVGVCFRMLMEGEYNWAALSEEHPITAGVWVWTFMLLLVLLMLNMVLAIVMDVYTESRRQSGKSETVLATLRRLVLLLCNWRRWIPSAQLDAQVETMDKYIAADDLREVFPNICNAQINGLFADCAEGVASNVEDQAKMQLSIFLGMEKISADIEKLYSEHHKDAVLPFTVNSSGELQRPSNPGWLQELAERMAAQNHRMLSVQWQLQQLQWQWMAVEATSGRNNSFVKAASLAEETSEEVVL